MDLRRIAAAIILNVSAFAADPGLVKLVAPDTKVMAGINIEQVKASPLGQYLLARIGSHEADLEGLSQAAGFDPRRDLREVVLAWNSEPPMRSGVILARGTFDVPRVLEAALSQGKTIEQYQGVNVVTGKTGHELAFLDTTLAIFGDAAAVRGAIDRRSASTSIGAELAAQAAQLGDTQDAWFVSLVPPNRLGPNPANKDNPPPGAFGTFSKVLRASGGIKLGTDAVLSLQAISQTDQDAAALAGVLKTIAGMVAAGTRGKFAGAAQLLQDLAVSSQGAVTKLSLTVPEPRLQELIESAQARPRGSLSQPMQVR